jgi:hypothetical protein
MPELEHWTMVLARAAGLRTAEAGLIPLSSGEPAFITKRFDREGSRRIHVEDLCQLSGLATEQKYRSSMEKVGTLVRNLATAPGDDALRLLEVTLFSFLVGNSDMHLKNWTLVRDAGRVAALARLRSVACPPARGRSGGIRVADQRPQEPSQAARLRGTSEAPEDSRHRYPTYD